MDMSSHSKSIGLLVLIVAVGGFTGVAIFRVMSDAGEVRQALSPPEIDVAAHESTIRDQVVRRWAAMPDIQIEDLYSQLRDAQNKEGWSKIIRQIAAAGPNPDSASVLMMFIDLQSNNVANPASLEFALLGDCNAIVALGITGGLEEHSVLLSLLREDEAHSAVAKLLRFVRNSARGNFAHMSLMSRLRASAALGLLLAGDEDAQSEVRELHVALKQLIDSGQASQDEDHLYSALRRSVQTKRIVERFGEEILFVDGPALTLARRVVARE